MFRELGRATETTISYDTLRQYGRQQEPPYIVSGSLAPGKHGIFCNPARLQIRNIALDYTLFLNVNLTQQQAAVEAMQPH